MCPDGDSDLDETNRELNALQREEDNSQTRIANLKEQNEVLQERIFHLEIVLKIPLKKVGKGSGDGFKAIGKKLDEILSGIVGAIASFIFIFFSR